MLDRQRSTKDVLLIACEASAEYAINNTSVYPVAEMNRNHSIETTRLN